MSKHTPGPWAVPHFAVPDEICPCTCTSVVSEHQRGMGAIATVHWEGEPGLGKYASEYEKLETAKANALLISAAPIMKDALHELVENIRRAWAEGWLGDEAENTLREPMGQALRALKTADAEYQT